MTGHLKNSLNQNASIDMKMMNKYDYEKFIQI